MASMAAVTSMLGGIPADMKKALVAAFREVLENGKIRLGRPGESERGENVAGHFYEATTSDVADQEFTVAHGFGRAPYLAIPVLDLQVVNCEIPPLKVTRAADAAYVYLSSSETEIPISLYVEG